jgi:dihydroneopterin aldolase
VCLQENVLGQKFVVDATLWADLAAAGRSDSLQDTIDYSKAYRWAASAAAIVRSNASQQGLVSNSNSLLFNSNSSGRTACG